MLGFSNELVLGTVSGRAYWRVGSTGEAANPFNLAWKMDTIAMMMTI